MVGPRLIFITGLAGPQTTLAACRLIAFYSDCSPLPNIISFRSQYYQLRLCEYLFRDESYVQTSRKIPVEPTLSSCLRLRYASIHH